MREIKALLPFAKPYRNLILLATLCMLFFTIMNLGGPWAIRSLIATINSSVDGTADFNSVTILAILIVFIYLFRAFARFGTDYISHYAAWHILENIRQHLYNHLQNLSLRFFSKKQTGELMSCVINDTRNFEVLLAHAIPTIVVNGAMLLGVAAILFYMNATLALYTLIPMPILAFLVLKFSKISRPLFRQAQDRIAEVNALLQDHFSGVKEIKSFTKEASASASFGQSIASYTAAILKALKISNAFHPGIEFVSGIGTVIVIFFGGRLALTNALSLEDLVAFLLYLELFYRPITSLGQINEGLQQALGSAERVVDALSEENDITEKTSAQTVNQIKGNLKFDNVSFSYLDKVPVLKDISFTVAAGETLALVGATGVGKTTIASLIPRFYDPTIGNIYLDHHNIRDLTLKSLRQQISLVSQDVFLFNGTVKQNICFGCEAATDQEIFAAAKNANAHNFILELEKGYDTIVGERGVRLSGGQKQRISIARALLKDAPLLILDEATSAVDTHTERLIQEALDRLKQNKTAIVIAHRLSTIKNAQQIIVLQEGKIAERGNHRELLKQGGLYAHLYNLQKSGHDLAV